MSKRIPEEKGHKITCSNEREITAQPKNKGKGTEKKNYVNQDISVPTQQGGVPALQHNSCMSG